MTPTLYFFEALQDLVVNGSTNKKGATHFVDIPEIMVVGMYECLGKEYLESRVYPRSFDIYQLWRTANAYTKRC